MERQHLEGVEVVCEKEKEGSKIGRCKGGEAGRKRGRPHRHINTHTHSQERNGQALSTVQHPSPNRSFPKVPSGALVQPWPDCAHLVPQPPGRQDHPEAAALETLGYFKLPSGARCQSRGTARQFIAHF